RLRLRLGLGLRRGGRDLGARGGRGLVGGGRRRRFRRRRRGRRRALRRDDPELRPDLDRLALADEDLLQDALAGARHLRVDLVRRDLEQGLVRGDVLALLLEPPRDRAL